MASKHQRSLKWIQSRLDRYQVLPKKVAPTKVVIVVDVTFFGRNYGILVVRCPKLKTNLYWTEVTKETVVEYSQARSALEAQGLQIQAVVADGRACIYKAFDGLSIQMCQFHQIQIIRRYLTSRPRLEAGKQLRFVALGLTKLDRTVFTQLLDEWHERWSEFLKERTYTEDKKHWRYTHRRIRSAYKSLRKNIPHLFTHQSMPDLEIPNRPADTINIS